MFENEIRNFKWKISDNLKIETFDYRIIKEEMECHLNIMKQGYNKEETPEIIVDCSYQKYINQFKKSEFFLLTEILVSSNPKGYILSIQGVMPLNGITIRKKIPKITDEQKKRRIEILLKNKLS